MANQEHLDRLLQGVKKYNQWRKKYPDIQPDEEHLDLLMQAVEHWNKWRKEYPDIEPDLEDAHLSPHFYDVPLNRADFFGVDFSGANLSGAHLNGFQLIDADFSGANLAAASFAGSRLTRANFSSALLDGTDLSGTDLDDADFKGAYLGYANLSRTSLRGTNFSKAEVGSTQFNELDLCTVKGLETVKHVRPSSIGVDTIYLSQGSIPEIFLRGAGVPDSFITYSRSLIGRPIDFYSCFISYSSKDQPFAERLYADLQNKGVRCWFAPEYMKIGDKIRHRIDESIRVYDKLLLVLSKHSVKSQWVEQEVETALAKEREGQPHVLFPLRLDEAVMQLAGGWPALIRNTRHIGDFTKWKQHDDYQQAFERLLRDLQAGT